MHYFLRKLMCSLHNLSFVLLTASLVVESHSECSAADITVVLGKQETVFPDGHGGMHYFPDEPITVVSTKPWVWFMVDTNKTVLMQGRSLETSVPVRVVLAPGKAGDFDASYAGISGFYDDKKRKEMIAVYHAEKIVGDGKVGEKKQDWAIGLATSKDGASFKKLGPVITCGTPRTDPEKAHHGVGDPSLCRESSGEWLYCYYTELSKAGGICLARSRVLDGARPGKWQKYFNGEFGEQGLGGKDTSVVPSPLPRSDVAHPNVQYLASLHKYVMTLFVLKHEEFASTDAPKFSGIYVSLSDDGIKWDVPQQLFSVHVLPTVGREVALRPYLHVEKSTADEVSGTLIYAYSPSWGWEAPHTPHFMVKRSIQMKFSEPRRNAESPVTDPRKALDTIQGEWLCVAAEEAGKPIDEAEVRKMKRVFKFSGDTMTMSRVIDERGYNGKFEIDKSPSFFNWIGTGPAGATIEFVGIYELSSDDLKLCFRYQTQGKATRPTSFKTDEDRPNISAFYSCKRVKQK